MFFTSPCAIMAGRRGSWVVFQEYQATSWALTSGVLPLVSSGGSLFAPGVVELQVFGDAIVIGGARRRR